MPPSHRRCPYCGGVIEEYRNPIPAVDILIELHGRGIVLIRRGRPPYGWAIPGGFVEYGESLEVAAVREAREETSLEVTLIAQFHTYSDPARDPRHHTIATAYVAQAEGEPRAGDDAGEVGVFTEGTLPESIVFDHGRILQDYFAWRRAHP